MIIYGRKPVLEAIRSGAPLTKIYLQYGLKGDIIDQIRTSGRKAGIQVQEVPAGKLRELVPQGESQGVAAYRGSFRFYTLEELVQGIPKNPAPVILALDSIQDTHNVGALLRTAEAAGINGVIMTKHNSAPVNDTVLKTSAGALEMMKISMVDNLVHAFTYLKENGYWILGTSLGAKQSYCDVDYRVPLVIVVGNEEKGMRPLVEKNCDILVKIPMAGKINSLNVSVAGGIMMFEMLRARQSR